MLLASGYSAEDATVMLKEAMTEESHVTMLDQNGYGGNIPMHAYMYQYMPYIILSILCYVIITIMMSFNNPEVRSRILCTTPFPAGSTTCSLRSAAQSSDLPSGFYAHCFQSYCMEKHFWQTQTLHTI